MRNKKIWALVLSTVSLGIHAYLTFQHYSLKKSGGSSFCSLNNTFDCDAVSLSSYATLFNIPVALLGFIAHLFFIFLILSYFVSSLPDPHKYLRLGFLTSSLIAFASIIMGSLSFLFMSIYCLLCITLYLLSFALFELMRREMIGVFRNFFKDLQNSSSVFITLLVFLALGYMFHKQSLPLSKYSRLQPHKIALKWKASQAYNFTQIKALFSIGSPKEKSSMIIQEFIAFLCPSCKRANHPISSFVKANKKNVRLEVYSFPLGAKNCDKNLPPGCFLVKLVHCAEKIHKKGFSMSKSLFKYQEEIASYRTSIEKLTTFTKNLASQLDISWLYIESCLQSQNTIDLINQQIQKGIEFELQGVPSIFVNQKLISTFTGISVLEAIYKDLNK